MITYDQALELAKYSPLHELSARAHEIRCQQHGSEVVTYLVDRNINYTNVCNSDCQFCAFYRPSSQHPEAYVLTREVLRKKIEEAIEFGSSRILLQGGHNDDLPYSFYVEMIEWIKTNFKIQINAFSPSEIQQMCRVSGKIAIEVLQDLQSAGLDGLPGGGAEILDDETRRKVSPKKIRTDDWLSIMADAHSLGLITTATMVIGLGEPIEHRLNHLFRLRDLQAQSLQKGFKGFNAFISWVLQTNENTSLGRSRFKSRYGASSVEYLRNVALARIILENIPHHQSSWPTLGPEIAEIGLHYGCDDIGSTMMEENVVSQAGAPTKHRWSMSPEELRHHIQSAGFTPAERDSAFEIRNRFEKVVVR
jgi:cyclic dehypoxanthinyl futalosine synthase